MIIPVELNGEKIVFDALPEENLLSVLRKKKLFSVKCGCENGICGFCTVLVNKKAVPSCQIPCGILRDAKIETLENFSKTDDYNDIVSAFKSVGVSMCGYCNAEKIFTLYNLLQNQRGIEKSQIISVAENLHCSCTEKDIFVLAVLTALENKRKREGIKKNE